MGALLARESSEKSSRSALDNLPVELQLACLSRVPYKDLREGVTCTCKSWRALVASDAFRKMRAASGFSEWAVFASIFTNDGDEGETADCYLITASGTYLTAPRPPARNLHTMRVASASGDLVAVFQPCEYPYHWDENVDLPGSGTMRAHVYNPRRNRWSPIAPLDREFDGEDYSGFTEHVGVGSVGSRLYVLGGGFDGSQEALFAFDAYDTATGEWSSLPELDFESFYPHAVEVDGKLWCYASQGLANETRIYDPETKSWTEGPDLPHELFVGVTHCKAFERDGRFCVLAKFRGGEYVDTEYVETHGEGSYSYRTFAWDPTREEWDENPFPPPPECASRCSCIDDHLIAFTTKPVGGIDFSNPDEVTAYQQGHTTRMYVLAPGDGARWIEWHLPTDARKLSTRVVAVRIG